jgi:hypothetical protein
MLKGGFLGFRQFKPSLAYTRDDVTRYAKSVDEVFAELAKRDPASLSSSPLVHSGCARRPRE